MNFEASRAALGELHARMSRKIWELHSQEDPNVQSYARVADSFQREWPWYVRSIVHTHLQESEGQVDYYLTSRLNELRLQHPWDRWVAEQGAGVLAAVRTILTLKLIAAKNLALAFASTFATELTEEVPG